MRNEINTSALFFVGLFRNLKRGLLEARRERMRRRFGAEAGDEARRFNRQVEAIAAYEAYLERAPQDLGVQLRLAGVLREAGRSEEAAVRLAALAESRSDKIKVKLALADTLDEIGSIDRAKVTYANILDENPSNVYAQEALTKIAHAAMAPDLAPPTPPPTKSSVKYVNLRIVASGASAESVIATVRSAQCAPNVVWSISVLDFEGELPSEGGFAYNHDEANDAERAVAVLHVEAGVILKTGALDWLLWAVDQGAMAAYADHEDLSGKAVLQSAPDRFDLATNPAPPVLAIFSRTMWGSTAHVYEALGKALLAGVVMHIPLVLSCSNQRRSIPLEIGPSKSTEDQMLVVIPTRDAVDELVAMVRSLVNLAAYPKALEIVVVDNGSRQKILPEVFGNVCGAELSVIRVDEPFNWSRLNNQACEGRDQPIIVFANNDMEMLASGWDDHLRALLNVDGVGVVGARLLYPNGLLQHGGIVLGGLNGEPLHDGWRAKGEDAGPLDRWTRRRPATAVTGGFMAMRRAVFEAVGGFDEVDLPISCSDVDFCLKAKARNWTVLYAPEIELRHHESLTRGHANEDAQRRRAEAEMAILLARWAPWAAYDPTRNPQWEARGARLYAGRRPLTTDQVVDWALKTASRPGSPLYVDTPTLA